MYAYVLWDVLLPRQAPFIERGLLLVDLLSVLCLDLKAGGAHTEVEKGSLEHGQ